MRWGFGASIVLVAIAIAPASAWAQSKTAQAEAMFQRGKQLMASGKLEEACTAFDASQKLEAALTTRLNQAACREKNGQLATAWGHFLEAAREARTSTKAADKQLFKLANERAEALAARVSTLQISIPAQVAQLAGLEVRRNNELVDRAAWNQPLPIDGGTYTISARASAGFAWEQKVTVASEKAAVVVEVPPERAAPPPPPKLPTDPPVEARPADPVTDPPLTGTRTLPVDPADRPPGDEPGTFTTTRVLALGIGLLGAGSIAFGAVRGVSALQHEKDAQALCPDPDPMVECTAALEATELTRVGHDHAVQANIGFVAGGVLVAGAVVLWFVGAPDRPERDRGVSITPSLFPQGAGFVVAGEL